MHKLDGNRTLAHSGDNALDRTVTHVTGYSLAGLAQLVISTDVAGPYCASLESGKGGIPQLSWKKSVFVQYFSSFRS